MDAFERDSLTMFTNVNGFFDAAGAALLAVPRIADARQRLADFVGKLDQQAGLRQPTEGVTGTRDEAKLAAVDPASRLRAMVLLGANATAKARFAQPVKQAQKGPEPDYLRYLADLLAATGQLPPAELAAAGHDPADKQRVATLLALLQGSAGDTRQLQTQNSTATDALAPLFEQTRTLLREELDLLLHAQSGKQPALVAQYDALRRIVATAAPRRPRVLKGLTHYNQPVLVLDRTQENLPACTLANRAGKGTLIRYYLAERPDAAPADGQGLVVKHREKHYLPDLSALGPNPNAPYLLARQESQSGVGEYRVEYTPVAAG